ncbi:MAG: exosortase system-associated protein, TIGR04073 family [Candidatus Omnitrophota bacterium]
MKKAFAAVLVIALVFSFTSPVFAYGPMDKLTRGAVNIVVSPMEVVDSVWGYWSEENYPSAIIWGPVIGTFNCIKRAVIGVYEVVTFPVPIPADYWPILDEPEFMQQ